MYRRFLRGLSALLFLYTFLLSALPTSVVADGDNWNPIAFSRIERHNGEIATIYTNNTIEMWHYSGGYWGGNILRIPDTIAFDTPDDLAKALQQAVIFEVALPDEVKAEIDCGSKIIISCEAARANMSTDRMYYLDDFKVNPEFHIAENTLYFKAYPQLNMLSDSKYDRYVSGLSKYIPIVNPAYGKNRYSIFTKSGIHLGAADGYIDANNPDALGPDGTIHPSQILNSSGHLKPGFRVYVDKEDGTFGWYDSGDLSIGANTFRDAGAVAMHFWYPMKITFYRGSVNSKINVRYWDTAKNQVFHQETVELQELVGDEEASTTINIPDPAGYKFQKWNVQLQDGSIQYDGDAREVGITLASHTPEKNLNVEFTPYTTTEVRKRYWCNNQIFYEESVYGQTVTADEESKISVNIPDWDGYLYNGWNVQLPDGSTEYSGAARDIDITLNGYVPLKYLNIEYSTDSSWPVDTELRKRFWCNGQIFYEESVRGEKVSGSKESKISVNIPERDGYVYNGWNIELPNGQIQTNGIDKNLEVTLTRSTPIKYLNVNYLPWGGTGPRPTPTPPGNGGSGIDPGDPPGGTPDPTPPPSASCDGDMIWTESGYHNYQTGTRNGNPVYSRCNHTFTYKCTLTVNANVTPSVLKSGYGFEIDANYTLSGKTLTSNRGTYCNTWNNGRAATSVINPPTKAVVYIPWTMTNRLGTQSQQISMESTGVSGFRLAVSPVSESGARRIYTDVALAGTKESPADHSFEIYVSGGGIGSVEWCKKLTKQITINGDMYEDDFSGMD